MIESHHSSELEEHDTRRDGIDTRVVVRHDTMGQ